MSTRHIRNILDGLARRLPPTKQRFAMNSIRNFPIKLPFNIGSTRFARGRHGLLDWNSGCTSVGSVAEGRRG
jgi:hypothetical protein